MGMKIVATTSIYWEDEISHYVYNYWEWCLAQSWFSTFGYFYYTGKPGILQSMGSQRIRHDLATEQHQQQLLLLLPFIVRLCLNPRHYKFQCCNADYIILWQFSSSLLFSSSLVSVSETFGIFSLLFTLPPHLFLGLLFYLIDDTFKLI